MGNMAAKGSAMSLAFDLSGGAAPARAIGAPIRGRPMKAEACPRRPLPPTFADTLALLRMAAPGVNEWLRTILAMALVNPDMTPDALFCLADGLEELAEQILLASEGSPRLQVVGLRRLAKITWDCGEVLVKPIGPPDTG
jgi:hypothetical protein